MCVANSKNNGNKIVIIETVGVRQISCIVLLQPTEKNHFFYTPPHQSTIISVQIATHIDIQKLVCGRKRTNRSRKYEKGT